MIGTYAAVVAVCVSALALGQAAICLCGGRRWSLLAPAVGLALLCALCWGTVRLPGDGVISAIVVLVLTIAAVAYLWARVEGTGEALAAGWLVALIALLAASLPFAVEGHFGILGTSFNPDMSQHLLTAARLAEGHGSQLLNQGYPLGPHSIVVALNKGLGVGLVQGFGGLTVAVAILACLTALAAFADLPLLPRTAGALLVGLAYVVASYFAQGAFKETMQALFLLAFVLTLRESNRAWADLPLRFVPAALIAVGSVYTYSFPGLIWLGPAFVLFLILDAVGGADLGDHHSPNASGGGAKSGSGPAVRALGLALLAFFVLIAPEIGRMIDFHSFETFDPTGPGLGNLFGQISPFEVLGIWPSGDFRLAPGDGAVPASAYYLGIAFALVLFAYGVVQLWRRREVAILSGLGAGTLAYAAARVGGTPYTAAKAIEIAAPLVAVTILLPMRGAVGRFVGDMRPKGAPQRLLPVAALLFVAAAGVCSLLALANAPVGPTSFSPQLSEFRKQVGEGPTLVVAPPRLLEDEHGIPFLSWELRGGRVCIEAEPKSNRVGSVTYVQPPPRGVRFVVTEGDGSEPPFADLRIRRVDSPYVLWEATAPTSGKSPCPLIAERQARQGPAR